MDPIHERVQLDRFHHADYRAFARNDHRAVCFVRAAEGASFVYCGDWRLYGSRIRFEIIVRSGETELSPAPGGRWVFVSELVVGCRRRFVWYYRLFVMEPYPKPYGENRAYVSGHLHDGLHRSEPNLFRGALPERRYRRDAGRRGLAVAGDRRVQTSLRFA